MTFQRSHPAGEKVSRAGTNRKGAAPASKAAPSSDADLARDLAESVSRAVTAALTARRSAPAVDLEPLTARVDGLSAGHDTLAGSLTAFADATSTRVDSLTRSYGEVDARVAALHGAHAAAPPATIARAANTARIATGK